MYPKELNHADTIPLWPVGKELEKYDKICKLCEKRIFNIDERICLVCQEKELRVQSPPEIKITSNAEHYYKCPKCETDFYSYHELV